jgi:hypothetical protein
MPQAPGSQPSSGQPFPVINPTPGPRLAAPTCKITRHEGPLVRPGAGDHAIDVRMRACPQQRRPEKILIRVTRFNDFSSLT